MLASWIDLKHHSSTWIQRCRLGPDDPNLPGSTGDVLKVWADAIVLEDNQSIIIEASVLPDSKKIGQIEFYKEQFLKTPRFSRYWDKPVVLLFLTAKENADLRAFAEKRGIIYEVYNPDWLNKWLADRVSGG